MQDYHEHELDRNDLIAAARKLWGKETSTTRTEWRFGRKGSKSVDLEKLVWRDHEIPFGEKDYGGGIVDLCRMARINGHYAGARPGNRPVNSGDSGDKWEPMAPPDNAPEMTREAIGCDHLYVYRTVDGNLSHYVLRRDARGDKEKEIRPLTYGRDKGVVGWHKKAPRPPLSLYRIELIRELDPELIFLVEGEKACDAANDKFGAEQLPWLALSWSGGTGRTTHADLTPLTGRRVAIWPDADDPGRRALGTLRERLPGASWIDTDGLPDKFDAADLRADESIKAFVEARIREPEPTRQDREADTPPQSATPRGGTQEELPPDISIVDFYAFLPKHSYLYVPTQTLWPPATIGSRLGQRDNMKATRWLDRHRPISQMIWAPGEPQVVRDKHLIEGGWSPKPGAIVFNQYRDGALKGGDPAQATQWVDLVKFLWPTPMEHEHIIRTFAFKLQHPAIKINHALVLGGGMRIGKDTVLVPIKRALGEWNCTEAKPTTIMSSFNGYMRSILLMINEARDLGEVKRHEFYLHMKDVIATPPTVVLINEKHEKPIHAANVCLVVMTTNHRTDGIFLPPDDGRHFPVWSERTRDEYEIDYFDRFYDWLDHGGDAHVAAYLRGLDVSDYRPGRPPEHTALFHEIVMASTPIETMWLDDILSEWKPTVFVLASLINRAVSPEVKEWLTNKGNMKSIPYRLAECGYTRIPNPNFSDGRWKVGGVNQNVYGSNDLSATDRVRMARELR